MHPLHVFLALGVSTANALPSLNSREVLAYRSWDLRLFSQAIPICNVNTSNIDLNVFHRYGAKDRSCEALDGAYNTTTVKSLSWKSPNESDWHDLCMFSSSDCDAGSYVGSITDGWEMCYPFSGWSGFSVVSHGSKCV
ncbi:sulfate transporter [Penicillium atrosanguineum]|uniref:sulfate transporter n=1 Tax=Penicillium atrosanguineum TaxID=1132637 RepID=UPI00239B43EE|nr:sulfate transporter [Penicillium atrosanguineum]KAJ5296996.1 sulfate transporter [Penicillium atrosanguineum]